MSHEIAEAKLMDGVCVYRHPFNTEYLIECMCGICKDNRGSRVPAYWYIPTDSTP